MNQVMCQVKVMMIILTVKVTVFRASNCKKNKDCAICLVIQKVGVPRNKTVIIKVRFCSWGTATWCEQLFIPNLKYLKRADVQIYCVWCLPQG
jgi:hypothetical protein